MPLTSPNVEEGTMKRVSLTCSIIFALAAIVLGTAREPSAPRSSF
jgi:hypothetical protein